MPFDRLARLAFVQRSPLLLLCLLPLLLTALAPPPPGLIDLCGGALLAGLGTALRLWSVRAIGKRARVRRARAERLLVTGPYARVRNPLYLANAAVAAGLGAILGGPALGVLVGALVVLVYSLVIQHEETALRAIWGEAYAAYLVGVPRWLPRLRPTPAQGEPPAPWAWSEVLRRELALVLGVPAALLASGAARLGWLDLGAPLDQLGRVLGLPAEALVGLALLVAAAATVASVERKRRRHERQRAALAAAEARPVPSGAAAGS